MPALSPLAWLSARFNRASPTKFILLAVLVAIGMTVFLIVNELSRVSSEGLDEAIAADIGQTGTYTITLTSNLGLTQAELSQHIGAAVESYAARPPVAIEVLPTITPECPPYQELGPQRVLILTHITGVPLTIPFGENLPIASEICFNGQEIPSSAIYIPTRQEQSEWGIGLVVHPRYRDLVALSTSGPINHTYSVITLRSDDQRTAIESAVKERLAESALRYGIDPERTTTVNRIDTGDSIRTASTGIKLVYGIIGWGVLILGSLGLLVAELIAVRDRSWFFGLSRAVGARTHQIALLIILDILLVLSAGTALALLVAIAIQPIARSFAQDAFQVDIQLIQATTLPRLMAGAAIVMTIASTYPAIVATRQDPLDVLEPKSS